MVTKYERQLERAKLAKRMKQHAEDLHRLAARLPFWQLDSTGDTLVMRDGNGLPLVTFHGIHGPDLAQYLDMLRKTSGMALANLIGACSSADEQHPGCASALALLQEMRLEPKPTRYRPQRR